MSKQTKTIWFFFALGALLVIIGTAGWLTGDGQAGGTASRRGSFMDLVSQIAYPAALIVFAGAALYLLIRRKRP